MRFGIFMAPFHPAGENPTVLLESDLGLIELLDRLGYDEAWVGEHHSAGSEIIASPEIFIANCAPRTRHIRLGTGVVSAAYHHPLWVAERAVLLDHLTRGRFMLGLGPGALPTDAAMIGLEMPATRELLEDATDVIVRLLRSDEPVTFQNDRWTCRTPASTSAPTPIRTWRWPSPPWPRRRGPGSPAATASGLLSIGATMAAGFDLLAHHWGVMEERAAHYGTTVDRNAWRLVGVMHLAETREQAYRDVEHGIVPWFNYFQHVAAFPQMDVGQGTNVREYIEFINTSGIGTIGTPDDAGEQIERLWKQSNGGFGAYLQLAHDWAPPDRKRRSFELFARHVMPEFQGQADSTRQAAARAQSVRPEMAGSNMAAVAASIERYQAELKEQT